MWLMPYDRGHDRLGTGGTTLGFHWPVWCVCTLSELETDRRPCALRSRLLRNLSRSFTSLNRKKTSLHSGWVSNNLWWRQREHTQKSEIRSAGSVSSHHHRPPLWFVPSATSPGWSVQFLQPPEQERVFCLNQVQSGSLSKELKCTSIQSECLSPAELHLIGHCNFVIGHSCTLRMWPGFMK